jgi:CHAD domain-containing protein
MSDRLLDSNQRETIQTLVLENGHPVLQRCARLLLLYDEGLPTREVAQEVGLSTSRTRHWRRRFQIQGMQIFAEILPEASPPPLDEQPVEPTEPEEILEGERQTEGEKDTTALEETVPQGEVANDDEISVAASLSLPDFLSAAKSLKSPGVEPDDSLAEAGRKVLRYHFAQMLLHERGTIQGKDIEELHDMRVATRRMRAAFEVFGPFFQSKVIKPHLKGLRATGKALGQVRDLDVFMEKAEHYIQSLENSEDDGLRPLIESWRTEREQARELMVAYLKDRKYQEFKESFYRFLNTPGQGALPIPEHKPFPSQVRDLAPLLIYERLAQVRAYDSILANASIEDFHDLRIEFKKLRYTLEFFREVLGEQAEEVIDEIKKMQDHLGDMNDAQIATEILRDFLSRWDLQQASLPVSQRDSPQAIMSYLTYRYNERHELMQTFHAAWANFTRHELRQKLALSISTL